MILFLVFFSVSVLCSNAVIPHWELAGNCGECQYCLVLHGYDEPYFCIFEAVEIPCYIRLHSFPSLYDADCIQNQTEIVDVTESVVDNSTVLVSVSTEDEPESEASYAKFADIVLMKEQLSSIFSLLVFIMILLVFVLLMLVFLVAGFIYMWIFVKSKESTESSST